MKIRKAEREGSKIINELKNEIWKVHEEIEKYKQVEDIKKTNEKSKINAKVSCNICY